MAKLYYPTYCRLDGIALGVCLAALKCFQPRVWGSLMDRGHLLLSGAGAFMAIAILALWRHYSLACSTVGFTLLNLSFAALTAAAVSGRGLLATIRIPGAKYLAGISYSVYLTHSIAIDLTGRLLHGWRIPNTSVSSSALTVTVILLLAMLLYHGVERPSLAFRDRLFRSRRREVHAESILPGPVDRLSYGSEVTGN
jgi:peptidoglycan/LPS O-acetylase OafA/YrhL